MLTNNIEKARFNMVEQQVRPWEVLDQRVLKTISEVPREEFVPQAYSGLAFADIEIPLGNGRAMLPPRIEARLLQALNIQPDDNILEIGTGSGYLTACLARMGGKVTSLDSSAEMTGAAQERLEAHHIRNVTLRTASGLPTWIDGTPFDAIAVTGSLRESSEQLQEMLKPGGRLFVVIGEAPVMEAKLITRVGENEWRSEALFETVLAPIESESTTDTFRF
jgi:protein-L-isoaspartate(D-aspartate) O-methyltransferase